MYKKLAQVFECRYLLDAGCPVEDLIPAKLRAELKKNAPVGKKTGCRRSGNTHPCSRQSTVLTSGKQLRIFFLQFTGSPHLLQVISDEGVPAHINHCLGNRYGHKPTEGKGIIPDRYHSLRDIRTDQAAMSEYAVPDVFYTRKCPASSMVMVDRGEIFLSGNLPKR